MFDHLPVLGSEGRTAKAKWSEPSRLQRKTEQRKGDDKAEANWRKAVWKRDGGKCRWCRRECRKCLDLVPERGECHHVVPRENRATRWDPRASLLVCKADHERLTGKVGGERFVVVASKFFTLEGVQYPDCSGRVNFKRIDKVNQ